MIQEQKQSERLCPKASKTLEASGVQLQSARDNTHLCVSNNTWVGRGPRSIDDHSTLIDLLAFYDLVQLGMRSATQFREDKPLEERASRVAAQGVKGQSTDVPLPQSQVLPASCPGEDDSQQEEGHCS